MQTEARWGLVLAGGGARGAYHVGVLRRLAELGFSPDLIAGTSIGALNGAMIASGPSFPASVARLEALWRDLGLTDLLRADPRTVAKIALRGMSAGGSFATGVNEILAVSGLLGDESAYFDPRPLNELVRLHFDPAALLRGTECWACAFPSLDVPGLPYGVAGVLLDSLRARLGVPADWLRLQDCSPEAVYELLLASAAIPIAFPRRAVNGRTYVDGGLADNVPLGALAARGCTHAVVVHLSNGSTWSRHEYPGLTILEIRPVEPIEKLSVPFIGWLVGLLDFRSERIEELQAAGYADAKAWLDPVAELLGALRTQKEVHARTVEIAERLAADPPLS